MQVGSTARCFAAAVYWTKIADRMWKASCLCSTRIYSSSVLMKRVVTTTAYQDKFSEAGDLEQAPPSTVSPALCLGLDFLFVGYCSFLRLARCWHYHLEYVSLEASSLNLATHSIEDVLCSMMPCGKERSTAQSIRSVFSSLCRVLQLKIHRIPFFWTRSQ